MNRLNIASLLVSLVVLATACTSTQEPTGSGGTGGETGSGGSGGATTASGGSAGSADGGGAGSTASAGGGGGEPSINNAYAEPPGSVIAGKTYGQWAAAWWQWAMSIPKSQSPILGDACDQSQPQDAFFLAGNFGGTEVRSCALPAEKPIFVPILNVECSACPEADCGVDATFVTICAENYFDIHAPTSLVLEVDGVSLQDLASYRAPTGLFDETQAADPAEQIFPKCGGPVQTNTCGVAEGSPRMAAGDGYWVMLHPLAPGDHMVRFAGAYPYKGSTFSLDITYQLTVTP